MKRDKQFSYISAVFLIICLFITSRAITPQSSEGHNENKIRNLIDSLEQMRAGIELYRSKNKDGISALNTFSSFKAAVTARGSEDAPYLNFIPINPFNNCCRVRFDGEAAGSGKAGWRYDTKTGFIQADDSLFHAAL